MHKLDDLVVILDSRTTLQRSDSGPGAAKIGVSVHLDTQKGQNKYLFLCIL